MVIELAEWLFEFLACLIFVLFLVAIFLTLIHLNERPLPRWSINSILSFYSLVFKGFLVFVISSTIGQNQWTWFTKQRPLRDFARYDDAGRDPLGAAAWLLQHGIREPLTAFGAILLIVATLNDPFIQQLVQYTDCSTNLTTAATIPRTNYYMPRMLHQGPLDSSPMPEQRAAWISGIFSPPADVYFDCSTGNCTFPAEYSTVGFCSNCEDISDTLEIRSGSCNGPDPDASLSLPSDLSITGEAGSNGAIFLKMRMNDENAFELITGRPQCGNKTSATDSAGRPLQGCDSDSQKWRCRGYGAASCRIGPCLRTYGTSDSADKREQPASISAGQLKEPHYYSSLPWDHWGGTTPFVRATIDTKCTSEEELKQLRDSGNIIDDDDESRWLAFNITSGYPYINRDDPIPANDSFHHTLIEKGCLYMINPTFSRGFFQYFLIDFLQGNVTGFFGASGVYTYEGPQALQHLYDFGNISFSRVQDVLYNASTALTNHIRENGHENFSSPAVGIVSHFATCVHIKWAWIALPAALAGLTLLLLVLSVIAARFRQAPLWKSSPLAFIMHANLQDTSRGYGAGASISNSQSAMVSGMERSARGIHVQLQKTGSSFRLVHGRDI